MNLTSLLKNCWGFFFNKLINSNSLETNSLFANSSCSPHSSSLPMLFVLPNYTEVQLVIYLEGATRFCAAEGPKRQSGSAWSQVTHLRAVTPMQAVFMVRKTRKCKGNTISHKLPPGHSDIYQTSIYPDTLFLLAQNTQRTAYFLIKHGMLQQGGFRDIGSAFDKAVLLLSINQLPELKLLIYPACQ